MTSPHFEQLVEIYRALEFDPGTMEGRLRLQSAQQAELLKSLTSDTDETGISIAKGDPDTFAENVEVRLRVQSPRLGLGRLYSDITELVAASGIAEPKRYFVVDPKFSKDDGVIPDDVTTYRDVLRLVGLLKEAAAYLDTSNEDLIFIHGGRYAVPVRYGIDDLRKVDVATLTDLLAAFGNNAHRDQKLDILAAAVFDMTSMHKPEGRFRALLIDLPSLKTRVDDGYRLFSSGFSYDKVKGAIQDAKIEFTAKIHKTFSDIQNQVLAIPIATVIVATQMKQAVTFNSQFWINTGVLAGCWIFLILFLLLLCNQSRSLKVIGQEIARQEDKITRDHKQVQEIFEEDFKELRRRLKWQQKTLWIVTGTVMLGFIGAHIVYAQLWQLRGA